MSDLKLQIGLIDNQEKFRTLFAAQLEQTNQQFDFLSWPSAEEFLRDNPSKPLDILFVDIHLIHMDGIELIRILTRDFPHLKTVVVTITDSEESVFGALRAGALGYVLKSELGDLQHVIEIILQGGAIMTPTIALRVMNSFRQTDNTIEVGLTTREEQVLTEIASGLSIRSAADRLGVTENTLNTHLKSIYKKLNVNNRVQLVERARKLGFLS